MTFFHRSFFFFKYRKIFHIYRTVTILHIQCETRVGYSYTTCCALKLCVVVISEQSFQQISKIVISVPYLLDQNIYGQVENGVSFRYRCDENRMRPLIVKSGFNITYGVRTARLLHRATDSSHLVSKILKDHIRPIIEVVVTINYEQSFQNFFKFLFESTTRQVINLCIG